MQYTTTHARYKHRFRTIQRTKAMFRSGRRKLPGKGSIDVKSRSHRERVDDSIIGRSNQKQQARKLLRSTREQSGVRSGAAARQLNSLGAAACPSRRPRLLESRSSINFPKVATRHPSIARIALRAQGESKPAKTLTLFFSLSTLDDSRRYAD
jgi:hypothetical protein